MVELLQVKKRTRLLVQKGLQHISLRLEEIMLIYTENKIVYVLDADDNKYICTKTLTELEVELDGEMFFRANRQYIISLNFIKGFKPVQRVKLELDLTVSTKHKVIISQETAQAFRKWISEA